MKTFSRQNWAILVVIFLYFLLLKVKIFVSAISLPYFCEQINNTNLYHMINPDIEVNRLVRTLTIITTYKCSASCSNCCFACSPQRSEFISFENAAINIDNAINSFHNIRTLVLTGGESLLNLDFVCNIISYAKKYNLVCRVVSNGFWGKNEESALKMLVRLKNVGLNELNISTGDDHLEYVHIDRVRNSIKAALSLGIKTIINLESGNNRNFCISDLNRSLNGLSEKEITNYSVIRGMWMPFTEESLNKLKPIPKGVMHPVMERCTNIFSGITISPNNDFLSCCGLPVNYITFFNVGSNYSGRFEASLHAQSLPL